MVYLGSSVRSSVSVGFTQAPTVSNGALELLSCSGTSTRDFPLRKMLRLCTASEEVLALTAEARARLCLARTGTMSDTDESNKGGLTKTYPSSEEVRRGTTLYISSSKPNNPTSLSRFRTVNGSYITEFEAGTCLVRIAAKLAATQVKTNKSNTIREFPSSRISRCSVILSKHAV